MTDPNLGQSDKPRWRYRFDNYARAIVLLREAIEASSERELSQLEREGIIQRFEYTWELAWKTIKDYLDFTGVIVAEASPRSVLKAAYAAGVITQGDDWMDALDARNKMSHTYNFKVFEQVISDIKKRFLNILDNLYEDFLIKALEDG